jgi:hypothetical protein
MVVYETTPEVVVALTDAVTLELTDELPLADETELVDVELIELD